MADIKAKDIAVAQSVAASDLILGSSIADTTANVRVDTLGNYIINNLSQSNIGNVSVSTAIATINNRLTKTVRVMQGLGKNIVFTKTNNIVIINSPEDMHMAVNAGMTKVCNIPEGFEPFDNYVYGFFGNRGNCRIWLDKPNGSLTFWTPSAIDSETTTCAFVLVYFTS